jgi:hypothetical protein
LITEVILYGMDRLARIGVGGGTLSVKKPDILQVCQVAAFFSAPLWRGKSPAVMKERNLAGDG